MQVKKIEIFQFVELLGADGWGSSHSDEWG